MWSKISKELWLKYCDGYSFTDCAIRNEKMIYLLAEEDRITEEQSTKMRMLLLAQGDGKIEYGEVTFNESFLAVIESTDVPEQQGLVFQVIGGSVVPTGGSKRIWPVEKINKDDISVIRKSKKIDGYAWAVGRRRGVFKRINTDDWISIDNGLKESSASPKARDIGFLGIDGFNSKDIYAVGGKGDIWHYDGDLWTQCGFPTNDKLTAVCCAKDDFVYVAANRKLWKGRLNQWESVHDLDLAENIDDLCWFDNKLWGCGQYDFFCWDGISLDTSINIQGSPASLMGSMACSEHFMLVACHKSAWIYDGQQWVNIVPESM